jgi:hypothetical protein
MTRNSYLCRRFGVAVALVTRRKIRVVGVEAEFDLKHCTVTALCPACSKARTFNPPRHIEKVVTTKPP